ncbi:MAG: DNA adenine methylase [Alphaproteobacteria bacterium]|nr:DNA adenine methylase [Alphaproteobacteria bacterium]
MCGRIHSLIPPDCRNWVDLFCGSAVVTLTKPRHQREVINDLNHDVVNLFDVLRGPLSHELYRLVELTPYAEELLHRVYAMASTEDAVEKAWRFLVTSWFGRGGCAHRTGFRWSKSQTTAPERTWANMPARLGAVAERLRGVCIRHDDAMKVVDDYDRPDSCLFADPPYPGQVGRRYAVRMDHDAHQRFAERLGRCQARVILTINPGTLYGDVLAGWTAHEVKVQGGGNNAKVEHILTNFEPLPLLAGAGMTTGERP